MLLTSLLVCRNPSLVLHAEFWAEDGWAWYPNAYDLGARSLVIPLAGYLQTLPRLVAWVTQAVPLRWAPTVFTYAALAIQAFPPAFLASSRLSTACPSGPARLGFALLWIALPNIQEVHANLTNAQWHLASLAFLVLVAEPARRLRAASFDSAVLVLSGLSGPFCLLLFPLAAWRAWNGRGRAPAVRLVLVASACVVQGFMLVHTVSERTTAPTGATADLLARIISQQVVLAPWIGQAHMAGFQAEAAWQPPWLPALVSAAALAAAAVAAWRGPVILRAACLFGGLCLVAALAHPQISLSGAQWPQMLMPGVGQRYYFMPMLAWLAVVAWWAGTGSRLVRAGTWVLLAGLLFGIHADWSVAGRSFTGFAAGAATFERSAPGEAMAFPVNPVGMGAPMVLVRR